MNVVSLRGTSTALALSLLCLPVWATTETFDSPVLLSNTQAPGTWYTDRYAPSGFASPTVFDGDNRLKHSISASDGANLRPAAFSGPFYNTQGRKFDFGPGTTGLSIDLYVDDTWATTGRRMAGLWGTAFNASNAISLSGDTTN